MDELGVTLRRAREAAGYSLARMATQCGYSKSYIGNAETGQRAVTPGLIRAYERVLGDDLNRRNLLIGALSLLAADGIPDDATSIAAAVRAEQHHPLASAQTSHAVDKTIAAMVAADTPSVATLTKWTRVGHPVLRVNAAGILAKIGSPLLDAQVARHLAADAQARDLYLTAVAARVLAIPWDEGRRIANGSQLEDGQLAALGAEAGNPTDAGARWCSIVLLARMRPHARELVDEALTAALRTETSSEHLRTIGFVLAGLHPTIN
ncbi:helix-turn-helix transcriptional regulator [Dactylosporangium sp. NPDC051485]|uniref:helix-turn-helix domain-containing protein n=1 Tax=Dactylosporangium sp. NPDC051485 TaxID=3154846 RepID=UPI003435B65D